MYRFLPLLLCLLLLQGCNDPIQDAKDRAATDVRNRARATQTTMTLTSIPNLVAYSRPNQLGLSNGAVVTTDTDFSSSPTYNGTPVGSPTYNSAKGAIAFNGTTQYITNDAIANAVFGGTNTPFSYLALVQLNAIGTGNQNICIAANGTGGTANATKDFYSRYASNEMIHSDHRNDAGTTEYTIGSVIQDTNMHVFGWGFDGTNTYLWLDGVQVAKQIGNVGATTFSSFGWFTEGCHRRVDGNTAFLNGWRGERGIWTRYLTNSEWASGTAYLQTLAGISSTPLFDPLQLAGAGAMWRSDSLTNSGSWTNGGSVTRWNSRGFNSDASLGMDLSSNQGGSSATYATNMQGGLPMLNLGGKFLFPGSLSINGSQFTQAGTPSFSAYGAFIAATLGTAQDLFAVSSSGGQYIRIGIAAAGTYSVSQKNNAATVTTLTGGTTDTSFHLWQFTFNGTTANLWIDGVLTITGSLSGGASNINYLTPAGGIWLGSSQTPWFGYIGEVGTFPTTAITTAQAVQIWGYDRIWWGLATANTQSLSATSTGTAAMVRSTGKILSVTSTGTPSFRRSISKTFTATSTGTAALVKSIGKVLAASAIGTALVSMGHLLGHIYKIIKGGGGDGTTKGGGIS